MKVIKRNGEYENIQFDKIVRRLENLISPFEKKYNILDPTNVTFQLLKSNYIINDCSTSTIDEYTAEVCAHLSTDEPIYNQLAGRICISNLHKQTKKDKKSNYNNTFSGVVNECYNHVDKKTSRKHPLVSTMFYNFVNKNKNILNEWIDYDRDYKIDYFGFKTLEKSYLLKHDNDNLIESPQDMFMRVAVALHMHDIDNDVCDIDIIKKSYDAFSTKKYTHATPTLFNAGTNRQQLSSCFLISIQDSLEEIYSGLSECAMISKNSGGIGIEIHDVRANNSIIASTNGTSHGIVPMLKVFEATARYVNQGGKRKGSIAVYLAAYHADVEEFLDLRKNIGAETERARDLFTALWISDLFMKRVIEDKQWSLMCPNECKGLADVYGLEFDKLYTSYENKKMYRKQLPARKLWEKIKVSLIETGSPYIHFKDNINHKNNQKNAGVIRLSNLCSEIMEVTNKDESAVCNLASVALSEFVFFPSSFNNSTVTVYSMQNCKPCYNLKKMLDFHNIKFIEYNNNDKICKSFMKKNKLKSYPQLVCGTEIIGGYSDFKKVFKPYYDFKELYRTTKIIIRNLNKVIDINYYPSRKTQHSNKLHRPIGLGVQGLADVYCKMRYPFDSKEASDLNKKIFETIYFAAVETSCELAQERESQLKELIAMYKSDKKNTKYIKKYMTKFHVIPQELTRDSHFGSYSSFIGSPLSKGLFQFNLWGKKYTSNKNINNNVEFNSTWDWNLLREKVMKYGTRNSLLTALMPTASTSQILGNNECFEPFTNNIYTRKTLAGLFRVVNKYLIRDLQDENLWNENMKSLLILNKGSIQNIKNIPEHIKKIYKTAYEVKQRSIIQQSVDRGPFIDQSQSMNLFVNNNNNVSKILDSALTMGWKNGLKTGLYYLRSNAAIDATQFTIDKSKLIASQQKSDDDDECLMCGS